MHHLSSWLMSGRDKAMKHFFVRLIIALVAAFGAPLGHAELLIGLATSLTGPNAWLGEQVEQGAELAVADLNASGGLLGERVHLLAVDDYCDSEQAAAAARKLVAADVVVVVGHGCSGASIPASRVYAEAGILMVSYGSTTPTLTEPGFDRVFRVVGRDDDQGKMAGDYLAERWGDKSIAILHDGKTYGQGLAKETKRQLNGRGVVEVLYSQIVPGRTDYLGLLDSLQSLSIDVLYYAGYPREAGLIIRQARDRGDDFQLVGSDALATEYFWHVAGAANEGVLFIGLSDPRHFEEAARVVETFRAGSYEPEGFTLYSYAAIQVWAQAVGKAGTFKAGDVATALRSEQFDTVLGRIGFDDNGDVYGYEPFAWYVWREGDYGPLDPEELSR
jgi:branched-chain amino acid transport system substrate-binding protein